MYATCIISWPISKVLDVILGEHKITRFNASQLGAIIKMHSERVLEEIHDHIETGDIGANRSIGFLTWLEVRDFEPTDRRSAACDDARASLYSEFFTKLGN